MVLAVPMTAVARIYLASVEHPLLRYLASVLAGTADELGGVGDVGGVGGVGDGHRQATPGPDFASRLDA